MQTKEAKKLSYRKKEEFLNNKNLWDLRHACIENIASLIEESQVLLENGFYPRAFLLGYMALEEMGKLLLVSDCITGVASENEMKKGFHDHNHKVGYWHNTCELIPDPSRKTTEATIKYSGDRFKYLFEMRNKSAYVNYVGDDYSVCSPQREITEENAIEMLNHVSKGFTKLLMFEDINERIGSKAFYK
ncbi:MAG: AbiV family abortive infection protein [Christensenellales bacterium]|jgi:AbiV family abortive infection protein